ncbi:RHS repeat domain-containing protein, partial [Xanthomonas translucens]
AAPVWVGNVADLIGVKRRKEKLAKLHERLQEYVYYPETFMPLALLRKEFRSVRTNVEILASDQPDASTQPLASPAAANHVAGVGSLGILGSSVSCGNLSAEEAKARLEVGIDGALEDASEQKKSGTIGWCLGGQNATTLGAPRPNKNGGELRRREGVIANSQATLQKQVVLRADSVTYPSGDMEVQREERVTYHYHVDPNGCPARLTNNSGNVYWEACSKAWGAAEEVGSSSIQNPLRFQGQYVDLETGLHYNRHRYYDAADAPPS